jgi:hypothetical protein
MTIPIFGTGTGLPFLQWQIAKHVSSAFTGATDDSHGDTDSASPTPTYRLFTVTGDVIIRAVWGIVNTTVTGATATLEVGVAGNTAELLAQVTATDLADGDVWTSVGADGVGAESVKGAAGDVIMSFINDGVDIIETSGTANVTAGQIDYYCIWAAAEAGASVVSAPQDTLSA